MKSVEKNEDGISSALQSVVCPYHLFPGSYNEIANAYPSQQTNYDAGDKFCNFVRDLRSYTLDDDSAK